MPTPIMGGLEVGVTRNWCGEHEPAADACRFHGLRWLELHSNELLIEHGISAVFYCPELDCDDFLLDQEHKFDDRTGRSFFEVKTFNNTIRLKILFHKLALREGDRK